MSTVIVTPTITARRATRPLTTHQWLALGYRPILVEQDPTLPLGHQAQLSTSQQALQAGLDTGADTIIYAEDDIDLDPTLADYLTPAPSTITSLFYRPRFAHHQPHLAPARQQSRWITSQALVMGRPVAHALTTHQGPGGIDIAVRHICRHHNLTIMLPPRPLVEHRTLTRAATHAPGRFTSQGDYRGPDSHRLAEDVWDWLPGRTDRKRVTTPYVAAATLSHPQADLQWVYSALAEMGCIVRDRAGCHRSAPLPWRVDKPDNAEKGLFEC